MAVIERCRSSAAGEKHLAVGCFLIDAQGRVWTDFRIDPGSGLDSVGGAALLQYRVTAAYEREQESR